MACFDVQGDIAISADGTRVLMVAGHARLRQRLRIAFQRIRGSWRWDQTKGLPLQEVEKLTTRLLEALLRKYILDEFPEITEVRPLLVTQSPDDPQLATVEYTVHSDEGVFDEVDTMRVAM